MFAEGQSEISSLQAFRVEQFGADDFAPVGSILGHRKFIKRQPPRASEGQARARL
jgi:hypothetical protein